MIIFAIVAAIALVVLAFRYPPLSLFLYLTTALVKGTLVYRVGFFGVVDYTVLCAVLMLAVMAYSFIKNGGNMRDLLSLPLWLYLILAALLLFGLAYTSAPNYGFQKSTQFATLGLIAFLAPMFFGRNLKEIKMTIWLLFITGIILAISTIVAPNMRIVEAGSVARGSFLMSDPLGTSAKIAAASIIAFCFAVMAHTSKSLRIISLTAIPVMMTGIIITESRGPFVALLFTWLVTIFICRKGISKSWFPFIFTVIIAALIIPLAKLPAQVTSRITNLWRGDYGLVEAFSGRSERMDWAIKRTGEAPIIGHGTGAFAVDWGGEDIREYPHNIILEVLYEQGMIGATILSLFLWLIFKRWRQASTIVRLYGFDIEIFQIVHIAGLLFLFTFIDAMKSGELNDSRFTFFCAGFVLAIFNYVCHIKEIEEVHMENGFVSQNGQLVEENYSQNTQFMY